MRRSLPLQTHSSLTSSQHLQVDVKHKHFSSYYFKEGKDSMQTDINLKLSHVRQWRLLMFHFTFAFCLLLVLFFSAASSPRLKLGPDEVSWSRSHRKGSFCPPPGKLQGTAIKVSPATTYWNSFPVPRPHSPGTMSTAASKFVFCNPSHMCVSSACVCCRPSAEKTDFSWRNPCLFVYWPQTVTIKL